MTKRTFHYLTECGWLFLALLPLFLYLAIVCNSSVTDYPSFLQFFNDKFPLFLYNNFIFTAISSIFGPNGSMPIFNDVVVLYLAYYIVINLAHLIVDVLLFIPRLAHGWMSAFSKKLGE